MQLIIVILDPWEINSISNEKDDLAVVRSCFHDYCEKDNLVVARLFLKINMIRTTWQPQSCCS
jgi:hypothetical protein